MIFMTYTVGQTFPDRTPERSLPSARQYDAYRIHSSLAAFE